MRNGTVGVDGGSLYYEDSGKGLPVVLIHAGYLDSRMWDNQIVALTKKYRVIRYDVRGYGKSSKSKTEYCDADDLKRILDHLEIKKAVLVGVSNGGRIVFDFAVSNPGMVTAIVAIDSGIKGYQASSLEEGKLWDQISYDEENYLRLRKEGKMREAAAIDVDFWSNAISGDLRNHILDISEVNVFTDETDPDKLQISPTPPAFEQIGSLKTPILFIVGSQDIQPFIFMNRRIHEMIPGSEFVLIDGADHLPSISQPESFRKTIMEFLSRICSTSSE
ncbi:MAG: alpha/beta fold hydrolase [Thermoplasmataceae archaeon]